ncbi:MAG: two-component regulator propeller domain-containing protein [bacterium]
MKYRFPITIFVILHFTLNSVSAESITNYTNGNDINCVAVEGNYIWCGTSGGVVRWNANDGTYVKYTRLADGLSDNDVRAAVIDQNGDKWFGTWGGGVNKFDGITWTNYTDSDGLAGNYVSAVMVDGSGNIWFGTSEGLSKYDRVIWKTYTTSDGLANNEVSAIAEDANGNIWVNGGGVNMFDGTNWTNYIISNSGLTSNLVYAIVIDTYNNKWFGLGHDFDGGVNVLDSSNTNWTHYDTGNSGLESNWVYSIVIDTSNVKWFGHRYEGISKFKQETSSWTVYKEYHGLSNGTVYAIIIDTSNNKWFGTEVGLTKFDDVKWSTFTTEGLLSNTVNAVVKSTSGEMWFATNEGLTIYDGNNWTTHLNGQSINDITFDGTGAIWANPSYGVSVSSTNGTSWTAYTTANHNLPANYVYTVEKDSKSDIIWCGTTYGIGRIQIGVSQSSFTTTNSGLIDDTVMAIAFDSSGNAWIGTDSGVSRYSIDEGTWTNYTTSDSGLADNYILSIAVDSDDNPWFGTLSKGVCKFDGTAWTTYNTGDGLVANRVYDIYIDGNKKWFATDGGVGLYDGTSWKKFTTESGLADSRVYSIGQDSGENMWFGTRSGLSRFEYTGAAGYNISGYVKTSSSAGISGVTLNLTGMASGSAATDSTGYYTFTGLGFGNYTVTPVKTDYTFTPAAISTISLNGAFTGWDFSGAFSNVAITPDQVAIPIGENRASIAIETPSPGKVKIIAEEKSKAGRGTINPDNNEKVAIVFNPQAAQSEYINQTFKVRVFTLAGELVTEFSKIPQSADDVWVTWQPENLASGIYVVFIEGPGVKDYKKVAVIR